jgi:hypothetical protein
MNAKLNTEAATNRMDRSGRLRRPNMQKCSKIKGMDMNVYCARHMSANHGHVFLFSILTKHHYLSQNIGHCILIFNFLGDQSHSLIGSSYF